MKQVLSTKTLNEETLAYARTLNLNVQCKDFIKIVPISFELNNTGFDSIAFTSSNAAKFFLKKPDAKELLKTKTVFALSGKTANILNWPSAIVANSAEKLAGKIISYKSKWALHPCGNLKLDILEEKLKQAYIKYSHLIVYETKLNVIKINKNYDTVLFYSPSGIKSFLSANKWNTSTIACCIGETTAEAFNKIHSNATIIVSESPTPEAMLKTVANYIQKHITEA